VTWTAPGKKGSVDLQATLAAASGDAVTYLPHHPISCAVGELRLEEDGSFNCDHSKMPPDSPRTQTCINASIAILLFEEAYKRFGSDPR